MISEIVDWTELAQNGIDAAKQEVEAQLQAQTTTASTAESDADIDMPESMV